MIYGKKIIVHIKSNQPKICREGNKFEKRKIVNSNWEYFIISYLYSLSYSRNE